MSISVTSGLPPRRWILRVRRQAGVRPMPHREQGRGVTPDASSDVYSLAGTVFEMLTGSKPFQAETALGMLVRHMHDPIPSARALRPDLSSAVDGAFSAGMAKDPREAPSYGGGLCAPPAPGCRRWAVGDACCSGRAKPRRTFRTQSAAATGAGLGGGGGSLVRAGRRHHRGRPGRAADIRHAHSHGCPALAHDRRHRLTCERGAAVGR